MAQQTSKNSGKHSGGTHECGPECEHDHSGDTHPKEEELQSKYYEFQLINEQIKQYQQQGSALDEQMTELQMALQGLTELETSKEGVDILVPISQGIFAKATLKDKAGLIVSVGNNVMVKKTSADTISMINERIDAVNIYKSDINKNLALLMQNAKGLEHELQALIKDIKG